MTNSLIQRPPLDAEERNLPPPTSASGAPSLATANRRRSP